MLKMLWQAAQSCRASYYFSSKVKLYTKALPKHAFHLLIWVEPVVRLSKK